MPPLLVEGSKDPGSQRKPARVIDPVVAALATAIVSIAGVLYRELVKRAERCEAEASFWRDRYLGMVGVAEVAVDAVKR